MKSKQLGKVTVRLVEGDISLMALDAVVNAANNELWMGSGVAAALKRRGGLELEEEAMRQGPVELGEAVVTSGYALPARYVIHAAAMGSGVLPDADLIHRATENSLLRCRERGFKTVAFPALGTGVGGFPLEEAARIMVKAVTQFDSYANYELEVTFALWGQEAYETFERVLFDEE